MYLLFLFVLLFDYSFDIVFLVSFFFSKHKTAYERRISDWSSDVCSSDLPWGSYDSIDQDDGFQVKRIKVKPGARLSLQSHRHRAEHWIVVRGTARVTRDNDVFELHANQSTYIPLGAKHRLEN